MFALGCVLAARGNRELSCAELRLNGPRAQLSPDLWDYAAVPSHGGLHTSAATQELMVAVNKSPRRSTGRPGAKDNIRDPSDTRFSAQSNWPISLATILEPSTKLT
jgi:hypothetical protein